VDICSIFVRRSSSLGVDAQAADRGAELLQQMIASVYTAAGAIAAQQQQMDAIANDVANEDTTAYKPQRAGGGPSFVQGELVATGGPLDLAIQGQGFFQVRMSNGQVALTRDGTFHVNAGGQLVDSQGNALEPPVTLTPGVDPASVGVASNGTVTANGASVGTIATVDVPAPGGLIAIGNGLYSPTAASGAPQPSAGASIQQGTLEASNTDPADSVVGMIEARTSTAADVAAFNAQDRMLASLLEIGTEH
jgi:flagellar basal-body rod protein FlgG